MCELFAGVGGFHVGLKAAGMRVLWANQWEPGAKVQHAFACYERHFPGTCVNADIGRVIDAHQRGDSIQDKSIPEHDVVVGGFPCQDYSVAKPLSQASGIKGNKGVLWWQIERWLVHFRPGYLILENVDRLLKSPSTQRGRDFAVMLTCLARLGYEVEWRVINAADYGFHQKRRRVFVVGRHQSVIPEPVGNPFDWMLSDGVLANAFPARLRQEARRAMAHSLGSAFQLDPSGSLDPYSVTRKFRRSSASTPFLNAGFMRDGQVWTRDVTAAYSGRTGSLGAVLQDASEVPSSYWIKHDALAKWKYLKGPKAEKRVHPKTGFEYFYSEGGIPFPDSVDDPARTILTGEGGTAPSRFKHIIRPDKRGRFRRLTPVELERLNGFDPDWTKGMPDGRRAFCMGNALVVGVVERIGKALATRARLDKRVMRRSEGRANKARAAV